MGRLSYSNLFAPLSLPPPHRLRTCLAAPGRCSLPRVAAARCRPLIPSAWWCRPLGAGGSSVSDAMLPWGERGEDRGVRPLPEILPTRLRSLLLACSPCSSGFPASPASSHAAVFLLTRSLPHLSSRVRGREQAGRFLLHGAETCASSLAASGEHSWPRLGPTASAGERETERESAFYFPAGERAFE